MGLAHLKRWQWFLISLPVGAALSYARWSMHPGNLATDRRSVTPAFFEQLLTRTEPAASNLPYVQSIRIYPPLDGLQLVTFKQLTSQRREDRKVDWFLVETSFFAKLPYKPSFHKPQQPDDNMTVQGYLQHVAKELPDLRFRYAWWCEPRYHHLIWIGGTVFVLTFVWPTIASILAFGTLTAPPRQKDEYDLSRYGKGQAEASKTAAPVPALSADDEVIRKLEENLAGFLKSGAPPDEEDAEAPKPIRKLNAGPQDPVAPAQAQSKEDKHYAGEFYPTVAHAPKKEDQ